MKQIKKTIKFYACDIGKSIDIVEGLYTVVKPDKDTEMFLARCSMSGYNITSFKMNFGKQTGIYIGNGRVMLAGGVVIIEL